MCTYAHRASPDHISLALQKNLRVGEKSHISFCWLHYLHEGVVMLFMFEIPRCNIIKSSFRDWLYLCMVFVYLYLFWPFHYIFQWILTSQMSRDFTPELLFRQWQGQLRILQVRTLTRVLGNSVTFEMSFLCVPTIQTSDWDGGLGAWTIIFRIRLRRFHRDIGLGILGMPWDHSTGTRTGFLLLLLFHSRVGFVHPENNINAATCWPGYMANRIY